MKVSAYIPCYNNSDTILEASLSIVNQSYPVKEFFVIDDGSTDNSVFILKEAGFKVYKNKKNMGRGYTRNLAVQKAKYPFILCCDATNGLEKDFLSKSIRYFKNENVASISGRLINKSCSIASDRWRARHLFKENTIYSAGPEKTKLLITYGTMMRKDAIENVGNFNKYLTKCEDLELGKRLMNNGYVLLGHTDVFIHSLRSNNISELYERYWRWYYSDIDKYSINHFWSSIKNSLKPMAESDLKNKDYCCAIISLVLPYYCLYKSLKLKK